MSSSFENFQKQYGGKVFVIFSTKVGTKKDIVNKDIIEDIKKEIERLKR